MEAATPAPCYSFASMTGQNTATSYQPVQTRLSINQPLFNTNLNTPNISTISTSQTSTPPTNHLPHNMYLPPPTQNTFKPLVSQPRETTLPTSTSDASNIHMSLSSAASLPYNASQTNSAFAPLAQPCTSSYAAQHTANVADNVFYSAHQQQQQSTTIRKLCDLPEFDGQPELWPMFAVSYQETTRTYNYTKLENLIRLQKALKGEAKAKVGCFLIHPESVDQVMKSLEFHSGRPQIIIRSQISKGSCISHDFWKENIENYKFLENAGATWKTAGRHPVFSIRLCWTS